MQPYLKCVEHGAKLCCTIQHHSIQSQNFCSTGSLRTCFWSWLNSSKRRMKWVCFCVVANISSAAVNMWCDYWAEFITVSSGAPCSWRSAVRRAQVCRLHWAETARQTAVACDWLRPGAVLSAGAKGTSFDLENVDVVVVIKVML